MAPNKNSSAANSCRAQARRGFSLPQPQLLPEFNPRKTMPAPSLLQLLGRPVMGSGAAASHSLDVWYFSLRAHRGTHRSRMFSVCFWRQRGSTQQPLSRGAPSTWDSEEEAPTACSPGVNGERKARCQMLGVASTTGVQGKALKQSLLGPRWVGSECLESALLSGRCACWIPGVLMPMVLS